MPKQPLQVQVHMHIVDGGDGSAFVNFYASREDAQKAADKEMEDYGQALGDNVRSETLEFDPDTLQLLNPSEIYED